MWNPHGRKHFPHRGLAREHTRNEPARYLPGTTEAQIRAIETETVRAPSQIRAAPPGKAEYLRGVNKVIGWDNGKDATLSFSECSGGTSAGRSYHGRPMAEANRQGTGH